MKRVLITGGAGFIGLHLAERILDEGHSVDLVDNFSRGVEDEDLARVAARPHARLIKADLLDPNGYRQLAGVRYDVVFHLAAIIGVAHVLNRPYDVLRDNVLLLERAITFAQSQRALSRFVFASTSEIYAGTLEHFDLPIPTPEAAPLALTDLGHPRTSYMLSKIYGEAMCRHSGLPFTIIRPHNFYGPRMGLSHVVPELLKKCHEAADGAALPVFSVDHRRTFCFIEDAVEITWRAACAPTATHATLNIGTQSPEVTIGELARKVIAGTGRRLEIDARPATPGSPGRRCPDTSKATEITGYAPRIDLDEGIRRTYAWYRRMVFDGPGVSAR